MKQMSNFIDFDTQQRCFYECIRIIVMATTECGNAPMGKEQNLQMLRSDCPWLQFSGHLKWLDILCTLDLVFCTVGYKRYAEDVSMMIGKKPNIWYRVCWLAVTPAVLLVSITFMAATQRHGLTI